MIIKRVFFLFFFSAIFSISAQNKIIISEEFVKQNLESFIHFYDDTTRVQSIETIKDKEFSPFKNRFFPKKYKKKFWFKVIVHNNSSKDVNAIFKIKSYVFYKKLNLYKVNQIETTKLFDLESNLNRKIDIPILLKPNESVTYFFEVKFTKAVSFPIQLVSKAENTNIIITDNSFNGFYYGFGLFIIILNVLFFIYTKNTFFIYYAFFQLFIICSIAFLDNNVFSFFGDSKFTRYFNTIIVILLSISSILFTDKALNLKKSFPLFKKILLVPLSLSVLFLSHYLLTANNKYSGFGKFFYLFILLFCYLTSLFYLRKKAYARFYALAFTVLLTCHILFIIPVLYGYKGFGFTEVHYKIGSIIEMLIFLAAIPYRHRVLSNEKEKLLKEVDLINNKLELDENQKLTDFKVLYNFTDREYQIFEMLISGKKNKVIAEELFLAETTIKYHCSKLYDKTNTKNKIQLISLYNSGNSNF